MAAHRPDLRKVLEDNGPETFFAVVATCGTTNFGIIDDLASVAEVCREYGLWFHVDGAYGGAGLAAPSVRDLYAGIEHCDSFIVDPHKWLFAPFDCCALLYREPAEARAAHTQKAGYLDVLTEADEWNPTDYSVGLTRRARGLPFWFSLAVNGTDAYVGRRSSTPSTSPASPRSEVRRRPDLELVRDRDLSVVVFRRLGWAPADYQAWSDRMLAEEFAFVVPTTARRRDAGPLRDRQPGDERRGRHRHPRHHAVSPAGGSGGGRVARVTAVPPRRNPVLATRWSDVAGRMTRVSFPG